jgi:hypothetical protein
MMQLAEVAAGQRFAFLPCSLSHCTSTFVAGCGARSGQGDLDAAAEQRTETEQQRCWSNK